MDDAIAVLEAAGRGHRRSRRHPERRRPGSRQQLPAVGHLLAASNDAKGKDDGLLGRVQVRHEARLQRVARVARRRGAGEDADRAARVEHRAPNAGAIKYGQSQLDISDEMDVEADARATKRIARRTCASPATHGIDEVMKAEPARRAAVSRARAAPRIAAQPGYPTVDRAVRAGAERADAGVSRRLRREAGAVRRQLHRHGLQRAAAARARLRVRTGDQTAIPSAWLPLTA